MNLAQIYTDVDSTIDKWRDLPGQVQEDLIAWFNEANFNPRFPEDEEEEAKAERLVSLYTGGRFKAWNCPDILLGRLSFRNGTAPVVITF